MRHVSHNVARFGVLWTKHGLLEIACTRVSRADSRYAGAVHMRRPYAGLIFACLVLAAWLANHYFSRIPDLPRSEAAQIISRTPEFNRYARLLNVEGVDHLKNSMDSVLYGLFTFVHLNSST